MRSRYQVSWSVRQTDWYWLTWILLYQVWGWNYTGISKGMNVHITVKVEVFMRRYFHNIVLFGKCTRNSFCSIQIYYMLLYCKRLFLGVSVLAFLMSTSEICKNYNFAKFLNTIIGKEFNLVKNLVSQEVKISFQKSLLTADFAMKYVIQLANHVLPLVFSANKVANHSSNFHAMSAIYS